jgi:hypothetical protein
MRAAERVRLVARECWKEVRSFQTAYCIQRLEADLEILVGSTVCNAGDGRREPNKESGITGRMVLTGSCLRSPLDYMRRNKISRSFHVSFHLRVFCKLSGFVASEARDCAFADTRHAL